ALVSGAPQSFVQDLSTPYYVRRPVVPLPHSALLTPQTHEGALMPMREASGPGYGGGVGTGSGAQIRTRVPEGVVGGSMGGVLGGIIGGVTAGPAAPGAGGGVYSVGGNMAQMEAAKTDVFGRMQPQATGRQLSELFEYDIKNTVTIGRNQSALVPILQAKLDAEKVTLWNAGESVPLRALWLTNNSGLALDAGTFDVMDGATFAGEGLFDTISAGQKRLISYAADPAVQVSTQESAPPQEITRIRIAKGMMMTTRELRQTATYRVSDSDTKPREVIIEHPVRQGWKISKDLKPAETTESYYRFRVNVNPKESSKLVVEEARPEVSQVVLSNLTQNDVELLARQQRVTPEMETAFRKILDQKNAVAALDGKIQSRQQDVANISRDQDRIRENMKALKGGVEEKQLLCRYVKELNTQEDRLSDLRGQLAALNAQRQQAADALDATIEGTTLDVTF
ncbi:MAG TPA: hypothetical protein VFL79_03915, partial [Terriglobia bacterium]|nr:hypothetical protein [Terriglobia bacterium]